MRHLVPAELPLDTFAGQCWLGVAPFHMSAIHGRALPAFPGISAFPELNVRTYVTVGGKGGVYFFSLDAASRLAVWAAKKFFKLPYFYAGMQVQDNAGTIAYTCARKSGEASFEASYKPCAPIRYRGPGTLDHWISERYCLYTVHDRKVYRAEIHHPQWPLQDAQAEIGVNTVAAAAGVNLPETPPLLHFAKRLQVLIWPLRLVVAD